MSNYKKCRRCKEEKPKFNFVDTSGAENPRGHFCKPCHLERMKEWHDKNLAAEMAIIPKLKIIYGEYWKHCAVPNNFSLILYEEREFCPYCGEMLPPQYLPENESTSPFRGRAQIDHMDPLSIGGEDSIRNAVYVCDDCNYKKRDTPFLKWLKCLTPKYRKLAHEIYVQKHGHEPEKFKKGEPTIRMDGMYAELLLDEGELKELFPEPIVDGPPSNEPFTVRISFEDILNDCDFDKLLGKLKESSGTGHCPRRFTRIEIAQCTCFPNSRLLNSLLQRQSTAPNGHLGNKLLWDFHEDYAGR